jgi:hypothetical protein
MAKQKPLIDAEGEVRELTASDFAGMKPFSALPKDEQALLRELGKGAKKRRQGERGKQAARPHQAAGEPATLGQRARTFQGDRPGLADAHR